MYMNIYIYVCMHIYMYICAYIYMYIILLVHVHVCLYMHTYIQVSGRLMGAQWSAWTRGLSSGLLASRCTATHC